MSKDKLESQVADEFANEYRRQGFEVIVEPSIQDIPFDLGRYRPDLIVKKPNDEGYIIEVKRSTKRLSIDRYQEIAETVSEQVGWRFLLLTGNDAVNNPLGLTGEFHSWVDVVDRQKKAEKLMSINHFEGAFLLLWSSLEALMRRQAEVVSLPIERFPTMALINHLYSQGELPMTQFDEAKKLNVTRNQVAHGIKPSNLDADVMQLNALVNELLDIWTPA